MTCRPSWPPGPGCWGPAAPARATWPTPARSLRLPPPPAVAPGRARGPDHGLRRLSDRRDDLVAEPTPTLSRLHVLLADLQPGGANRELTATRAAALLRQIHHHGGRRRGQADRSPVAGRRAPPGPAGQDGQPGIRQAVREHGTTASSPRPRPLRRPAGASNDTCPTWSTATWSPITATVPGAVDTQRRYRVTFARPVGACGHTLSSWPTDQLQGTKAGETSGQTSHRGHHPDHRRERFLYELQGRPCGRPPAAAALAPASPPGARHPLQRPPLPSFRV